MVDTETLETRLQAVERALTDSDHSVAAILNAQREVTAEPSRPIEGSVTGPVTLSVDGAPSYLTLAAVTHESVPAVNRGETTHPLVARNQNLFTIPYGDVANTVTAGLGGNEERTGLRTAAQVLKAARSVSAATANESLATNRRELEASVSTGTGHVTSRLVTALRREGVGASDDAREQLVEDALGRWQTPAGRALALANGSATRAVARAGAAEDDSRTAERLAVRLDVAVAESLQEQASRPTEEVVNTTLQTTRTVSQTVAKEVIANATEHHSKAVLERRLNRSFARLPAGLPVAPVPGYWYATTNLWTVDVAGAYTRFTVASSTGPRGIAYTRAGQTVTLDVDDDGVVEQFGRAPKMSFTVETAVVVVVPPGRAGVGDIDGDADERSPGWPTSSTGGK
ncbi:hypothetical protein ACFQH3_10985 [Haladaptatus sp. GCM10025707]|uniref:DUF7286 family protein n=1 Tax=unclassified Haladaptatus TaxID=2622732 RepID=UPI0023E8782B|nr:hypothetical protein [Haladaptatus sp. QDMS2]